MDRTLIEKVVIEVLKNLSMTAGFEHGKPKPALLIVKGAGELDPSQSKKLESKWNVIYQDRNEPDLMEEAEAVLFLDAGQDLLVKGAVGITDTPDSELLARCLLAGIPVTLIVSPLLEKAVLEERYGTANKSYVSRLIEYKKTLNGYGAKVESLDNFIQTSKEAALPAGGQPSTPKKLLTQRDVKDCKEEKISINEKTIVTPLARDTARELGKTIFVTDSKGADIHANGNSHW
jgi:hypothetical protein